MVLYFPTGNRAVFFTFLNPFSRAFPFRGPVPAYLPQNVWCQGLLSGTRGPPMYTRRVKVGKSHTKGTSQFPIRGPVDWQPMRNQRLFARRGE